jgi:hypothetical protein
MSDFIARVVADSTDDPRYPVRATGRVAGPWVEFDASVPGSGFSFWACPAGDSYDVLDAADPADGSAPTAAYLDAARAADLRDLGL